MANLLRVPVPVGTAVQCWSARNPGTVSTVMFYNRDPNNYVYVGQSQNIQADDENTFPIAPNGAFIGDPTTPWYLVGEVTGIVSLVVIPNGQSFQFSLTQGMGDLVIPSIQSPDYVPGVSGWMVSKDGDAEFNDVTVRGVFDGTDYEIDNDGIFFFLNALQSLLSISMAQSAGTIHGQDYRAGISVYNAAGDQVNIADDPNTGQPIILFIPHGTAQVTQYSYISGVAFNAGTPTEQLHTQLTSGRVNSQNAGILQLYSDTANGTGVAGFQLGTTSQIFVSASDSDGVVMFTPSGLRANPDLIQVSTSTFTNNNQTAFNPVTFAYTIPANDATTDTVYKLRAWGAGTTGNPESLVGLRVNAFGTNAASTGWNPFLGNNQPFYWECEATLTVGTIGTSAKAWFTLSGTVSVPGRSSPSTSAAFNMTDTVVTFDSTTAHAFSISAAFGTATGGAINTLGSVFHRLTSS